jgi:hypothetical protein
MSNYHARMMNIPCPEGRDIPMPYRHGHRDARHSAATIGSEADAEIERLRKVVIDLEAELILSKMRPPPQASDMTPALPTAAETACWHGPGFVCPLCHPVLSVMPDSAADTSSGVP